MLIADLLTVDPRPVAKKMSKPTLVVSSVESGELAAQREMLGEPKRMLRGRGRRWPRGIYRSAGAVQPFARRLRAQSRAATFASVLAKASSSGLMAKKIPLPVKLQCLGKNPRCRRSHC